MIHFPELNLEVYRGDDTTFLFDLSDVLGTPIDLAGSTVAMDIQSAREKYRLVEGAGIETVGNTVNVIFDHDLTKDWKFRLARYDLQVMDSAGKRFTVLKGEIHVRWDVTTV